MGSRSIKKCIRCGICCENIPHLFGLEKLKSVVNKDPLYGFLEPIEKPNEKPNRFMLDWKFEKVHWYRCKKHNIKTGECMIYDNRPESCQIWPVVGLKEADFLSDECGFLSR